MGWGILLAAFLLSALAFTAVTYIKDKTLAESKPQSERQLGMVEIAFSVLQAIGTLVFFMVRVLGTEINFEFSSLYPLAFSIIVIIYVLKDDATSVVDITQNMSTPSVDPPQYSTPSSSTPSPPIQVDITETTKTQAHADGNQLRHRTQNKV